MWVFKRNRGLMVHEYNKFIDGRRPSAFNCVDSIINNDNFGVVNKTF